MGNDMENKESLTEKLKSTKKEVEDLGGLSAFKNGDWLFRLVQKSFRNYWDRANPEYLRKKYPSKDDAFIIKKLTKIAAKNAALIGGVTGAVVSADEVVAVLTGAEGGVGLPANVAVAAMAIAGEAVLLVRFQLKLVANIGKIYNIPLDPEDPEDILTILAFAAGGSVAETAGKFGMKIGKKVTTMVVKEVLSREALAVIKRLFARLGIKIMQRTIMKYAVPLASIGIGSGWNYLSTRAVGKVAARHFEKRREELGGARVRDVPD